MFDRSCKRNSGRIVFGMLAVGCGMGEQIIPKSPKLVPKNLGPDARTLCDHFFSQPLSGGVEIGSRWLEAPLLSLKKARSTREKISTNRLETHAHRKVVGLLAPWHHGPSGIWPRIFSASDAQQAEANGSDGAVDWADRVVRGCTLP